MSLRCGSSSDHDELKTHCSRSFLSLEDSQFRLQNSHPSTKGSPRLIKHKPKPTFILDSSIIKYDIIEIEVTCYTTFPRAFLF